MKKTPEQLQKVIDELREVCARNDVVIFGTCNTEGIYGEISICDSQDFPFRDAEERITNKLGVWVYANFYVEGIGSLHRIPRMKAPWPDFAGNEIYIGDVIQHPSGQTGTVLYLSTGRDADSQWLVDYGDVCKSRLTLQIGDKGRAVVIRSPLSN